MDEICILIDSFLNETSSLETFISSLNGEEKEYYRRNQPILYIGVINRTYSLWETLCKDLAYFTYTQKKAKLISSGEFVQRFKLSDLPGYIVENGVIEDEYIKFELKKDYVTYTAKNMTFSEMKSLFERVAINVEPLKSVGRIKDFLDEESTAFGLTGISENMLSLAVKRTTEERNVVSHFSSIDTFVDLYSVTKWIELFKILAEELANLVIKSVLEMKKDDWVALGKYVRYLSTQKVLCTDIADGTSVDKKSLIIDERGGKIYGLYRPRSFMVNDKEIESVSSGEPAGIGLDALFSQNNHPAPGDSLFVFSNFFS